MTSMKKCYRSIRITCKIIPVRIILEFSYALNCFRKSVGEILVRVNVRTFKIPVSS